MSPEQPAAKCVENTEAPPEKTAAKRNSGADFESSDIIVNFVYFT